MKKRIRHCFLERQAVEYVVQVKAYLQQDGRSFKGFSDIIQEIKNREVNPETLAEKLKEFFKERQDLIMGFRYFLPDELQLGVGEHDGSARIISYSVGQEDLLQESCHGFKKIRSDKEGSLGEGFEDGKL